MGKRRGRRSAVLGSAVVAVLTLGACGDEDQGPIPQTGVSETTTTTAASTSTTTTTPASTTTTVASTSTTTTTAPAA